MNYLEIIEDNPDIQRAINEGVIERVLTNREVGIRTNSGLTKEQKKFLRRDENSLIVMADELIEVVEKEIAAIDEDKSEWAEQARELRIQQLWKDGRFGA